MRTNQSLQQLKSYIDSQEYKAQDHNAPPPQPFVTLSRQTGSGAFTIGKRLCELLSERDREAPHPWLWFDRDLVRKVLQDHQISPEIHERLHEAGHNPLLAWFDDVFSSHPSWSSLVRKIGETIVHLSQLGCVIVVGRGAHLLTRGMPHGLHVRLVGSRDKRITQIQRYYGMSREEATKFVEKEDRGKARYLKQYFDRDIQDPLDYDMLVNTDHVSYEDAAVLIADQIMRIRGRMPVMPRARRAARSTR